MTRFVKAVCIAAIAVAAFMVGRWSVSNGLLAKAPGSEPRIATFSSGALRADAAEEQDLHLTPDFLRRYSEDLARVYLEKAFEEPFQKKLPTEPELKKFFEENQAKLARPERVRIAHLALLAPRSDGEARARKAADAQKLLQEARRTAKDDYAFGRLALTRSEDPRSRPAAGELPFATREELSARLGPEAAEVAFDATPGRIVERVVETEQGFHLVKVIAREAGHEASWDELRDPIKARLTADRREQALKEFMDALWARWDVKIDDAVLKQVAPDAGARTSSK